MTPVVRKTCAACAFISEKSISFLLPGTHFIVTYLRKIKPVKMIEITIQKELSVSCISLEGRLDTLNSPMFDEAMRPLADAEKFLIVDLSQCIYLSSTGIRILLGTFKKLKAKGGLLFLSGLRPEIFSVLEMAGLHSVFCFSDTVQAACEEIQRTQQNECNCFEWEAGGHRFRFLPEEKEKGIALCWSDQEIAGYNELGIAVGIGSPADSPDEDAGNEGLFVATGNCAGFIPADPSHPSDFRIPHHPGQAGIWVKKAVSFHRCVVGRIGLAQAGTISLQQMSGAVCAMSGQPNIKALVVAGFDAQRPTISVCLVADSFLNEKMQQFPFQEFNGFVGEQPALLGARFELDNIATSVEGHSLQTFLDETLTLDNILNVSPLEISEPLSNPVAWILGAEDLEDASSHRMVVLATDDEKIGASRAFLIRRLYTDSIRVELKKLHGGYSAQTFQVESYDRHGRKLRPTVLKFADRAMITREAERCRKYSLPYILNNSAMVLGSEFFGNEGALRYNFVGIGGEQTRLKWLTHYFADWTAEQLAPLFDKIFLQILNPWYGQSVREAIYPFRDHDPTVTFFPHIFDTAFQLFGISPDEEFFTVEETGQKLVNPYWFLKHAYPARRDVAMEYCTSICHGDLNMQNILLDQNMNVYLIDFSETRPRSVVSDFARLEAILMTEYAPVEKEEELVPMVQFATRFYSNECLDSRPEITYQGTHPDILKKNVDMVLKMRSYAFKSSCENPRIEPYYLALLEWIFPVICYSQLPLVKKKYAMIVSALLCEKIRLLL